MRTDMDWSGHELIITDTEGLLTHYLKKPGTLMNAVMFINTNGVLVVTGDYSNWMFDREFHPSKGGFRARYLLGRETQTIFYPSAL